MKHQLNKVATVATVLLAGCLSSCNSIFEDVPTNKLSENRIWSDPQLLDEYILPWYESMDNGFKTLAVTFMKGLGAEYEAWFTDQMTVSRTDWYTSDYGNILKSSQQDITQRARTQWLGYYNKIRSINNLLEHMDLISEGEQKERLKGEAHFFRAYYYYLLLRNYGGPLIITRTLNPLSEGSDATRYPRASFEQTVKFIVEEANLAAQYCPIENSAANVGRPTKGACYTLAGKACFWASGVHFQNVEESRPWLGFSDDRSQEMLLAAEKEYDKVKALNVYALMDIQGITRDEIVKGYRNIFLTKNSVESIWEVQVADDGDYSYKNGHLLDRYSASPQFGGTYCAYVPTQNHVDEYAMENGKGINEAGSGYDKNNPYVGRDPRFYANILYDGAQWRGSLMDIHTTVEADGTKVTGKDLTKYGASETAAVTKTGYYLAKFLNEKQSVDYDETYGSSQNCIIWRWAEILLDYAEIYYQTNRTDEARQMLNIIRNRVHMPAYASVTWENIMNERRVEMAFEKTTYWDLLRYGTAEKVMSGKTNKLQGINITYNSDGSVKYQIKTVNGNTNATRYFRTMQYFKPIAWEDVKFHGIEQNPTWIEM